MTTERQEKDRPSSLNRSERPKRTPIHGKRDIMNVKGQEPGWHYCWVNDGEDYRGWVERFIEGGYEFVSHDVTIGDKQINAASQIGGKISMAVGNGVTGFLMRCPEEVYLEELEILHAEVDEKERSMRQQLNSKDDGRYGSVEIQSRANRKPLSIR